MTINQQLIWFRHIVSNTEVKNIKQFMYCENWEIEGNLKPGTLYPLLVANCEATQINDNSVVRTWRFMLMDRVLKDKSNEEHVLSDTEFTLSTLFNLFKNGNDVDVFPIIGKNITVVGDPVIEPFKEEFGDWCAGWQGTINLETENVNDPCFE